MIYLVELRARPGQGPAVLAQLERLRASTLREPGAVAYLIHHAVSDPDHIVLYERYASQAAADAHMGSAPVREALDAFATLLAEPPRLLPVAPVGGFAHGQRIEALPA